MWMMLFIACVPNDPLAEPTGGPPTDEGTQAGDEGDEDLCEHHRVVVDDSDVPYGDLEMTAADFLAVVEVPVSGEAVFAGGQETLTLDLTVVGDVEFASATPKPEHPDAGCHLDRYVVEVDARLQAGEQLEHAWTTEADGILLGNVRVGFELPLADVTGTLEPQRLQAADWDSVVLRAFGGSTDGIWTFNMDWRATGPGPSSDEEDIGRFTLVP